MPKIAAFRGASEIAITIATQQLFNINSKAVRRLANRFVPTEGNDMIPKGLTVMHITPNRISAIKDETQNVSDSVLKFKNSMIIIYDPAFTILFKFPYHFSRNEKFYHS